VKPEHLPPASAALHEAGPDHMDERHRGRLFRRYLLLMLSLVSAAVLVSGALGLYFSYQENRAALADIQHEKAVAAAARIEQYISQVSRQLGYASLPQLDAADTESRRIELLKLLRQVPEVTDIAQLDAQGREQISVSRMGMDVTGSGRDRSAEPAFQKVQRGKPWYGPVTFRKETEPYMTIALRSGRGIVTLGEVNLKFVWDVASRIKVGDKGKAYVVDGNGYLVADPDISLVLRKTQLGGLPHIAAALAASAPDALAHLSHDLAGVAVLSSVAPIDSLGWRVFVEQPAAEVYDALDTAIVRTVLLLLGGLVLAALGALVLTRSMVRPIRALADGARRIGAGELGLTLELHTGDELEGLAGQFNRMTAQLRESYAGLERKVEERTRELQRALDQQTAIAEILRVTSASPSDVAPVLEAVARHAATLCEATQARIFLARGDTLHLVAGAGPLSGGEQTLPLSRISTVGRSVLDHLPVHGRDRATAPAVEKREGAAAQVQPQPQRIAEQTTLAVPLLREDHAFGAIQLRRSGARPFGDEQVALLCTFADQAAIALENVRLFEETREALQQQRALADVLSVISNSVADTQPAFDKIMDSCKQLFAADSLCLFLVDAQDRLQVATQRGFPLEVLQSMFPHPRQDTITDLALRERRLLHYADVAATADLPAAARRVCERIGVRSLAMAPLLWEGVGIGSLLVARNRPAPFSGKEQVLLGTFADQAVIAIQNARLFRDLEDKSHQLGVANQHKSEFLANMSHELRTPLNAIIGFSEVLIERMFGELNDKQADYLNDIHESGRHLLALINDILDLSKIEAGRMELDTSEFDAGAAIGNALALVRERAQRHGIKLELALQPALGTLRADERKFKQILLNLLSNAVKFTPDGGSITVLARRLPQALEVAVRDTGIGIAEEDQRLVFEAFRQAGRDDANKHEGTGLGLALSKRFVELHGGRLTLHSVPGQGSTFTFTLPSAP
jgi:signal transduction histidine kinase/HAMP domain-containing protein/AraC-like DNA-binding protein